MSEPAATAAAPEERRSVLRRRGARESMLLGAAMVGAGGLDYLVNIVAGRWLDPVEFGVFVSANAIVQVLTLLTISIRVVVAFYTADVGARDGGAARAGAFVRASLRWAWLWGGVSTLVMIAASPAIAHALRLPTAAPILAASAMTVMLFVREASEGALQGVESFGRLGVIQVVQAAGRLAFAVALVAAGTGALGALVANPLGSLLCIAVAAWWLRPQLRAPPADFGQVSWRYSLATVVGLTVFGLLTNVDALFVRRYFEGRVAGEYGAVLTLAKICLFLPWAIGLVLFPKVAARRAAGRDARPILLLALAAALAPGAGLSALYFAIPGFLVRTIFGPYPDPGLLLGLAGTAATLYAGMHIWLNYALSLQRKTYVVVLLVLLVAQLAGMWALGRTSLTAMVLVMIAAGVAGNVAGFATTGTVPMLVGLARDERPGASAPPAA